MTLEKGKKVVIDNADKMTFSFTLRSILYLPINYQQDGKLYY